MHAPVSADSDETPEVGSDRTGSSKTCAASG